MRFDNLAAGEVSGNEELADVFEQREKTMGGLGFLGFREISIRV